jgi:uncharacterized protein YjbI with pentapeptide repeats
MVILESRLNRNPIVVICVMALGSMSIGACGLSSLHVSTPSHSVVSGRCNFLSASASLNYQHCSYAESNYDNVVAPDLHFDQTNWAFAQLNNVKMQSSTFVQANFAHVTMTSSNLAGANFRGVNFTLARLMGSLFANAEMQGADFTYANLRGAKGLGTRFLAGTIWHNTICPDGTNSERDGGTCLRNLGS